MTISKTPPLTSLHFSKHPIIINTAVLTCAGIISRLLGFLYRIFLSNIVGAELLGIFQLVIPIYILFVSIGSGGIQIAMSRFVAENVIYKKNPQIYSKKNRHILASGIILTLLTSSLCTAVMYLSADNIAIYYLHDLRTRSLIKILAFAVPMTSLHACIIGYYFGCKKTGIPASMQILEQIFKITALLLFFKMPQCYPAVLSLVLSELSGSIFLLLFIKKELFTNTFYSQTNKQKKCYKYFLNLFSETKKLLSISYILTLNKVLLTILSSIEATLIPFMLIKYGFNNCDALSRYGTFTGMALPVISFPSALIGSVALVLLPELTEANVSGNNGYAKKTALRISLFAIETGIVCCAFFIISSTFIGDILFHEPLCSTYIKGLSWICPFLYVEIILGSILHSLGLTNSAFVHNVVNSAIRLVSIIFLVPKIGISGYMYGLFVGTLITVLLHYYRVQCYYNSKEGRLR